jgi:hypothetical protein
MERFLVRQHVDLSGKYYAICELGNYYGYDDFEFGASESCSITSEIGVRASLGAVLHG